MPRDRTFCGAIATGICPYSTWHPLGPRRGCRFSPMLCWGAMRLGAVADGLGLALSSKQVAYREEERAGPSNLASIFTAMIIATPADASDCNRGLQRVSGQLK